MVGGVMLKVLEERNFPVDELLPVASAKSVGSTVCFRGKDVTVIGMEEAIARRPDIALFSAGGGTSLEWAPRFAEVGCTVIDNSSGEAVVTDGPFSESKEIMGGFWVVEAPDLDAALELGKQAQAACGNVIEVRPLQGE